MQSHKILIGAMMRVAVATVTVVAFSTSAFGAESHAPAANGDIHIECGAFRRGADGQWSTVRPTSITVPQKEDAPQRILLGPANPVSIYLPAGMPLVQILNSKCGA